MSKLCLRAQRQHGRTVVFDSFFTAPLKIAQPFYQGDRTEVMMMAASAGMLAGDHYHMAFDIDPGADLTLTGQSYTKVFRTPETGASQKTVIHVQDGAVFHYLPPPVILFAGSRFSNETQVYLAPQCRFAMWDILSCGRTAMQETLQFHIYRSRTAVYVADRLCFLDNQRLVPGEADLAGTGFFEGYSHMGLLYLYGYDTIALPQFSDGEIAQTQALARICVRMLCHRAETAMAAMRQILHSLPIT